MWEKALREVDGGCVLRVEVSPGAVKDSWVGYDQWREAIKVRIAAEPRDGKANEALISLMSETFGVASSNIRVLVGGKSRIKEILIAAVDIAKAQAILAGVVGR